MIVAVVFEIIQHFHKYIFRIFGRLDMCSEWNYSTDVSIHKQYGDADSRL